MDLFGTISAISGVMQPHSDSEAASIKTAGPKSFTNSINNMAL